MASDIYREIGRRIRRAREHLDMSQEELARRLNYQSPATISYFEAGERKVSIADLQRIASILGLPLGYFLDEAATPPEVRYFRLRAREVRPAARTAVTAFLSFAQKHGSSSPRLPPGLAELRPGRAAERVLQVAGETQPPVMPREVAGRLGVPVFDWEFPDEISGICVIDGATVCIGVNEAHPHVRQRFTIAHELGHLVYTGGRDLFMDFVEAGAAASSKSEREQMLETKANQFAADLLMPQVWVQEEVRLHGLNVTLLAKRFEVSEQALWFRLLALRLVEEANDDQVAWD